MDKKAFQSKYAHITLLAAGEAATQTQVGGTIFRKQVVKYGKWVNPLFPVEAMTLDEAWGKQILDNFNSGVVGKIPIPMDHTDETEANTGEVIGLESVHGDGLYALLDIRRPEVVDEITGGLIFDVSISFDWNYVDTKDGKEYGPTLLHVALVNNPYLKGMKPFEQVAADITNKLALPQRGSAIMLSEAKAKELSRMETATIKNNKAFNVTITVLDEDGEKVEKTLKPNQETEVPKDQSEAILKSINEATDPADQEAADKKAADEKAAADKEAADKKKAEDEKGLSDEEKQAKRDQEELADLRKKDAIHAVESSYNTLLSEGKITPAQKDKFMQLSEVHTTKVELSGKQVNLSTIVTEILQAGPKVVKFSEDGSGKGKTQEERDAEGKKPSESLSEAERAGFKAVGADPKKFDEYSEKYPELVAASLNNGKDKEN